jgi:inhibitor of KinA sporulation pathway (predicted exonuclease)
MINLENIMKHYSDFGLTPLMAVVDIETLDTAITAVIASIGCVVVNVFTGEVVAEFYERCELMHQSTTQGRTKSESTKHWWVEQITAFPAAFRELYDKGLERDSLYDVLPRFNDFLTQAFNGERVQLMGNGPEFDNAKLEHAMYQFDIKPAWDHGANQSLRTAVWMGRMLAGIDSKYTLELDEGETKHHALHDARHEAKYLCAIFQALLPTDKGEG